jgi:threonine synthase
LKEGQAGVFLETAHPAKFTETVEKVIGEGLVPLPEKLGSFMKGIKQSVNDMSSEYDDFRRYIFELK